MANQQVRLLRVIDGDTVEIMEGGGMLRRSRKNRVRLYGIDAPESSQKGGGESTRHLRRLIGSRGKIWMESTGEDRYGRTVGILFENAKSARIPGNSYNYRMVRDGQARVYMARASDRPRYQAAEDRAKSQRRGIWRNKKAIAPWDYRQEQRNKQDSHIRLKLVMTLITAAAVGIGCVYIEWWPEIREQAERLIQLLP